MKLINSLALATGAIAEFTIEMKLCTDQAGPHGVQFLASGGSGSKNKFFVQLDDGDTVPVGLNYYYHNKPTGLMSMQMDGDLTNAEQITLTYNHFDILCLEMLRLTSADGKVFKIIQDYDPHAWDVTTGNQSWQSVTGEKISYWANNCDPAWTFRPGGEPRELAQTLPFLQSCHQTVSFSLLPVNECENASMNACHVNASCTDTVEGYTCQCNPGFIGNGINLAFAAVTRTSADGCTVDPNWTSITNISEMASNMLIDTAFNDYGCAGRGVFDAFESTIGKPIDAIDEAFLVWKHCIKCASDSDSTAVTPYVYDIANDSCATSNSESRRFCECDRALMSTLVNQRDTAIETPYPAELCHSASTQGNGSIVCCAWDDHFFAHYNTNTKCCGVDGIKEIGTC